MTAITMQQRQALDIARGLVSLGIPLFLAHPDPGHVSKTGFALPTGWQLSTPDPQVVDNWRPGMALCMVTGHGLDLVDLDPRSGGGLPPEVTEALPVLATQATPSGGTHLFVMPLSIASRDGVWSGVDVKSGMPDGFGRGFAFLAPTVRMSKVTGQPTEYSWRLPPTPGRVRDALNWVRTHGNPGAEPIRARVAELRAARPSGISRTIPVSVAKNEWNRACAGLVTNLRHWQDTGWGGEAHAGLLSATTHLARLSPEHARDAFLTAFAAAGLVPDEQDLIKIDSAIATAVPDTVLPDEQMSDQGLFWAGAAMPESRVSPPGPPVAGLGPEPTAQAGYRFTPITRDRYRDRKPPRKPGLGTFGGAHGLFYAEGVHWLQGESESGKSWVAQGLAAERLRAGESVLYVDYEDTEDAVLGRFAALGVTDDEIEHLVYVPGEDVLFRELTEHASGTDYAVMVIDGVTSSLSAAGLSGRDEQELTRWTDALPRRARMAVCVDHVVKAVDERRGMAIGSQAKKSVVTGTAWEVVCPPNGKFGQGKSGFVVLNIQKDKPGGVRGVVGDRGVVLKVLVDPLTGAVALAAKRTEEVAQAEAFQEASKAAEALKEAEAMYLALTEQFSPGASMRSVIAWAIGSENERKLAGKGDVGAHPSWHEHRLRSAWRVWAHVHSGPGASDVAKGSDEASNQLERDLHAYVGCTLPDCVSDLETARLTPKRPGQPTVDSSVDFQPVDTNPATQFLK